MNIKQVEDELKLYGLELKDLPKDVSSKIYLSYHQYVDGVVTEIFRNCVAWLIKNRPA